MFAIDPWLRWSEDGVVAAAAAAATASTPRCDSEPPLRGTLRSHVTPELVEAIYVASPHLGEAVSRWLNDPEIDREGTIERTVAAFFSRTCGRAMPFGLFAGVSVGTIGADTTLCLAPHSQYVRKTRMDMRWLCELTKSLSANPLVSDSIRYVRNSSALVTADDVIVFAPVETSEGMRSFSRVVIERTPEVESVLTAAQYPRTILELAQETAAEDDRPAMTDLIREMVAAGVLLSELEPLLSGDDATRELSVQLESQLPELTESLSTLLTKLAHLDRGGIGQLPPSYSPAITLATAIQPPRANAPLFHVDLMKPSAGLELSETVSSDVIAAFEHMRRLVVPVSTVWTKFRQAFYERYGENEVPLLEALDPELGLPFGRRYRLSDGFLSGLGIVKRSALPEEPPVGPQVGHLLRAISCAVRDGSACIELSDAEYKLLSTEQAPRAHAPESISIIATLIAASIEHVRSGEYKLLVEAYGPSASLLGRYAREDNSLGHFVPRLLRQEQESAEGAVLAEVVHWPFGGNKLGNILQRPALRRYEIPYIGRSTAAQENQIAPADLCVSLRNDAFVLRSRNSGVEVRPRLSSAHAFQADGNLPVYQFLAGLQYQSSEGMPLIRHPAIEALPFVPRIMYGRLTVCVAQWRLRRRELEPFRTKRLSDASAALDKWRESWRVPRYVLFVDGDKRLPIDLANIESASILLRYFRVRDVALISEMYPGPDDLCVRGPEGRFHHQILLPVLRQESRPSTQRRPIAIPIAAAPTASWQYLKVYASPTLADRLLVQEFAPVVLRFQHEKLITLWHFLRYGDPEHHLRVRFQATTGNERALQDELTALCGRLSRILGVVRVQTENYAPETTRYGGQYGLAVAEAVFDADSSGVLTAISTDSVVDDKRRWLLAAAGITALLTDFGLAQEDQMRLVRTMRDSHWKEFGIDARSARPLAERYRVDGRTMDRAIGDTHTQQWLQRRSERLRVAAMELESLQASSRLSRPTNELLWSFVHMHVNRIIVEAQREHEVVLYDYLFRFLRSSLIRASNQIKEGL